MGGFVVVGICRICRNGQRVRPRQLDNVIDFTWLKSSEESSTPSVILRSRAIQILIEFVSAKKFWESHCVFNDRCRGFRPAANYYVVKVFHKSWTSSLVNQKILLKLFWTSGLTFFLYAWLLRALKALELGPAKARLVDGNPRVGIALEWHQVVLARHFASKLAWDEKKRLFTRVLHDPSGGASFSRA